MATARKWQAALDQIRYSLVRLQLTRPETVALAAVILFASAVGYFYFFKVQPLKTELDGLELRERAAHNRILDAATRKKKLEAQRANANLIVDSIDIFERRLKDRQQGTPAIISEVNNLASQHRVTASDYNYRLVAAESDEPASASSASRREDTQLNVYSALNIDTTVVGDYRDLRRLISAIERSNQFIVILGVAFQGESERPGRNAIPAVMPAPAGAPVAQAARPVGDALMAVSLKIEMETYFRNEGR